MSDPRAHSPSRDVWDQFRRHRGAVAGGVIFLVLLVGVVLDPLIWQVDPAFINILARNQGPSLAHPFGTDQLGRDTLARMIAGGAGLDGRGADSDGVVHRAGYAGGRLSGNVPLARRVLDAPD